MTLRFNLCNLCVKLTAEYAENARRIAEFLNFKTFNLLCFRIRFYTPRCPQSYFKDNLSMQSSITIVI